MLSLVDFAAQEARLTNPLLAPWTTPEGAPPFTDIRPEHFAAAFEAAMQAHIAAIAAIKADPSAPTFDNTLAALERAPRLLEKIGGVFWNLTGAHTNEALQAVERDISPKLAVHYAAIYSDAGLFARIDALYQRRNELALSGEQLRLLERMHIEFVRSGAQLPEADKGRYSAILERLASLGTAFSQNVLSDESGWTLELDGETDLAGLPDFLRNAALRAGAERGLDGKAVITLSRSSIEPFLQFSTRRDLREKAFNAWVKRGENAGPADNRAIVTEMVALRLERAKLLGYATFADFKLDDTMARTPQAVSALLEKVWAAAVPKAHAERDALAKLAAEEGQNIDIAPWDWRFYAEKLRRRAYDFDEAQIKPYLPLEAMISAAFHTAEALFGLAFTERTDVPTYHPDVRVWQVSRAGQPVGLFMGDYFARPSKRSGAWMSAFRSQQRLDGSVLPIIVNVMNFSKGEPALLSLDDARTLFHEFGHALHGLMSDVTYPTLAGTAVASDFVELPSQLYEHWLLTPEILSRFARHHASGEAMPKALIDKVMAARTFNQGFATIEYCASALVDMAFHALEDVEGLDPIAFEGEVLSRVSMPQGIVMRHRTPHFTHVFSGDGYSAGYYSYLWSEVLDADAFDAFREAGSVFDAATAERLGRFVYSAGNLRAPDEAYVAFRGRLPSIDPLLEKRGLAAPAQSAA